ncbi:hypothetical protein SAMN04489859_102042 [Paracoccus alcaliphilus]|uniref:Uncharacterized protein n=1 Tax=Paracoccus alcaliphilus TaxID=34002 RepID=A0A1H8K580_9RHOB|nr:zinc finger-like domain-containing protein [Paracoccus alcaliphilus]WCR17538.1 zinc finger-like domain-containing protein [Paracoccus alcaliphilus]SEN87636.1 hypothetical protein SAMN04489859_102042 [Paracoccus alcaliphilus]
MTAPKFLCDRCDGTGERFDRRCHTCKGRGGWSTSPEARAKAAKAAKVRRIRAAQEQNRSNPGLYMAVVRNSAQSDFLKSLRTADARGEAWTTFQRNAARQIIDAKGLA